jgi:TolA-binding protein
MSYRVLILLLLSVLIIPVQAGENSYGDKEGDIKKHIQRLEKKIDNLQNQVNQLEGAGDLEKMYQDTKEKIKDQLSNFQDTSVGTWQLVRKDAARAFRYIDQIYQKVKRNLYVWLNPGNKKDPNQEKASGKNELGYWTVNKQGLPNYDYLSDIQKVKIKQELDRLEKVLSENWHRVQVW